MPLRALSKGRDAFVTSLYRENLGTLPDQDTLNSLAKRLAAGADPVSVARQVWGSPEHRSLVKQGLIAPISLKRTLSDALRAALQAVRIRPPAGPAASTMNKPSS